MSTRLANLSLILVAAGATLLSLVDVFGFVEVSEDVFQEVLLLAAGVVLFAFAVDASGRTAAAKNQVALLDATQAVAGLLDVRQIRGDEIGVGIEDLLNTSRQWIFRGGSGRYLRYATLPVLARIKDQDVKVEIQILDPRDESLCAQYAKYRQRQRPDVVKRQNEGDPLTIQADLLANIYAAAWYSANTRILPNVVLLRSFSRLRYDIRLVRSVRDRCGSE